MEAAHYNAGPASRLRLRSPAICAIIGVLMPTATRRLPKGEELISLAQKLARDAERHALLSASLASQADRLMLAGLRLLEPHTPPRTNPRIVP
jgi:hypothetical protein